MLCSRAYIHAVQQARVDVRAVRVAAHAARQVHPQEPAVPADQASLSRRALLATAATLAAVQLNTPATSAEVQYQTLRDEILAYQFDYPVATVSGRELPLVVSRRPEKYSSAAPLTADARQRIVCELADLIDAVTISVTVGPPGGILCNTDPSRWTPKLVAEQVLLDKSTGRLTTGQRVSLNSVESVAEDEREGGRYIVYEHISQRSPTLANPSLETYRRALAVTAVRPGSDGTPYLYTLNLACPADLWDDIEPGFRRAVDSFRLVTPGSKYVAPDKAPLMFF